MVFIAILLTAPIFFTLFLTFALLWPPVLIAISEQGWSNFFSGFPLSQFIFTFFTSIFLVITLSWKFLVIWKAFKSHQPTAKQNFFLFLLSFTAFTTLQFIAVDAGLYSILDDYELSVESALHPAEYIIASTVLGLMFLVIPLLYNSQLKKKQIQTKTDST